MQSWCIKRCFRSSGIAESIRPFTDRHLNANLNKQARKLNLDTDKREFLYHTNTEYYQTHGTIQKLFKK